MSYRLPPGLVAAVAENLELPSKAAAHDTIEAILDALVDQLHIQGRVSIGGFGTLELRERAARAARNPKTGEPVSIPPRTRLAFTGAKTLNEQFN